MRSLRTTLLAGTIAGTSAVLVASGVLLYLLVRHGLVSQLDRSLLDKARLLASVVEHEGGKLDLEYDDLDMREFRPPAPRGYLQLSLASGQVIFRSPSLGDSDLPGKAGTIDAPVYQWAQLPDGHTGRVIAIAFQPRGERHDPNDDDERADAPAEATSAPVAQTIILAMARRPESMAATLASLRIVLIGVACVAVGLLAGSLWLVIRKAMVPLHRTAERIGSLGAEDLSERLDSAAVPVELRPVIDRLNDMLGRLEAAFLRERSFSADVAHELRTPLAGIRSALETSLASDGTVEEYREGLADSLAVAVRMQSMVAKLLMLARLENGEVAFHTEPIRPAELIDACWEPLAGAASRRGLSFANDTPPKLSCAGDPEYLVMAVSNVLANAVQHSDDGGRIRVTGLRADGTVEIAIANTGCGLSGPEAEQAFDRFWRADASREGTGIHAGLGLALVRRIVRCMGGDATAGATADGVFTVTLLLAGAAQASDA
jgi:two-component system heavy metal sensor histidine kinase CusS